MSATPLTAQNRQNPAGTFGQPPSPTGTDFQYSVSAPGRLVDPSQFEDIVLRAQPDTSLLRIRDIGRVQLGAQTYSGFSRVNGRNCGQPDRLPVSGRQRRGHRPSASASS